MVTINYRDGRPIYEQVKDDLRRLVVTGAMQPGEKLPSVRELAVSLAINPNTIQRAYRELESEGYELRWLGVSEEEIIEKIGGDGHGEH